MPDGRKKWSRTEEMERNITIAEISEQYGRKPDTIWRKAKKAWPGRKWSVRSEVTEAEWRMLLGVEPAPESTNRPAKKTKPSRAKAEQNATDNQPAPGEESLPARPKIGWRECIIVGLLIAPTAASVRNMYTVTYHLSEHATDAVLLTTVLSVSALGFVAAGIRSWWAVSLAVVLILFESFCNLTRIYGGLMGTGATGNPTRFLGLVCDIFGSGSHWTAVVLGGITALFIAAVQYAAIFELNKTSA